MRIGSLFSGIGGLELGLERAGLGHTVWQVERDRFCRAVLERHWPAADRHDDVCAAGAATLAPADLICGGFPCQDVSSAGNRAGLAGERSGLWREYARIVGELRPRWVVVENVASGARLWLDTVVRDLGELGYASLPIPVSAADCGAPHLRRRVFVVARMADADSDSEHALAVDGEMEEERRASSDAYGSVIRQQPGRGESWAQAAESRDDGEIRAATDANSQRRDEGERCARARCAGWTEPRRSVWEREPPEPSIRRVDDGLPRRVDHRAARLRALGNAVVPQCAEVVGWVIRQLEVSP